MSWKWEDIEYGSWFRVTEESPAFVKVDDNTYLSSHGFRNVAEIARWRNSLIWVDHFDNQTSSQAIMDRLPTLIHTMTKVMSRAVISLSLHQEG